MGTSPHSLYLVTDYSNAMKPIVCPPQANAWIKYLEVTADGLVQKTVPATVIKFLPDQKAPQQSWSAKETRPPVDLTRDGSASIDRGGLLAPFTLQPL
jgi:hypothetical protein